MTPLRDPTEARLRPLPNLIFASRWLQLPLYLDLIAAQAVYVFHFWVELWPLVEAAFGHQEALASLVKSVGYKEGPLQGLNEKTLMWQTAIHLAFLLSALAVAAADRIVGSGKPGDHRITSVPARRPRGAFIGRD